MAEYEMIREIPNLCKNNRTRDTFVEEVVCEDPEAYVRALLAGKVNSLTADRLSDGTVLVYAESGGIFQKFSFTPI